MLRHPAMRDVLAYNLKSVLRVSRTFSTEALQIIFKTSLFNFDEVETLRNFVDRVPEQSLSILANLQIHLSVSTWARNLLTLQLVRSCILGPLPGLSYLDWTTAIGQNWSYLDCTTTFVRGRSSSRSKTDFTIKEQLLSSITLPQLKCAILKITVNGDTHEIETIKVWARQDFDKMRHLVTGQVA